MTYIYRWCVYRPELFGQRCVLQDGEKSDNDEA